MNKDKTRSIALSMIAASAAIVLAGCVAPPRNEPVVGLQNFVPDNGTAQQRAALVASLQAGDRERERIASTPTPTYEADWAKCERSQDWRCYDNFIAGNTGRGDPRHLLPVAKQRYETLKRASDERETVSFRRRLKQGTWTNFGPVLEIRGEMVKVPVSGGFVSEVWVPLSYIYPPERGGGHFKGSEPIDPLRDYTFIDDNIRFR